MLKKTKFTVSLILSALMLLSVGCSSNNTTDDQSNMDNSSEINTANATTKEDYEKYLNQRYEYYFDNSKLYNEYDIYSDNFMYDGTNEDFVSMYDTEYNNLKTNLESFKNDLTTNVVRGDAEVDKYNDSVISSIDNTISSINQFGTDFSTKAKDYVTLTTDEMVQGVRDLGKLPHEARLKLDDLVENAKDALGID